MKRSRSLLAATLTAAVALSALVAASPAAAATLNPSNEINGGAYTFTIAPSSASGIDPDAGESVLKLGVASLKVDTGCPEGYRASSRTYMVTPDGVETGVAVIRKNQAAPLWGLQGKPITLTSIYSATFERLDERTFPTGINRLVITCDAEIGDTSNPIGDAKYFVAFMEVDRATDSWKQVSRPAATPDPQTATSTTLAASDTTATATTLSATVAPSAATGTVAFTQNGTAIGEAQVTNGVATWSATGLTADTEYTFGAQYLGDSAHLTSTATAVTVRTAAAPVVADTAETGVTVSVPAASTAPEGLKITASPSSVQLQGPTERALGQSWVATGSLGTVTVTDARADGSRTAWSLSGQSSVFTSSAGTIGANALGWTPSLQSGPGTAGAASTDLSAARPLVTGGATTGTPVSTSAAAALTLTVPPTVAAGDYTAKLTLTLI